MSNDTQLNIIINGEDRTKDALGSVDKGLKTLASTLGSFVGFQTLKNGVEDVVKAFGEQQAVQAQTVAVLQSTGGVAGVTAQQVNDLANSLSTVTQYSDDTVGATENLLLTFTKISSDIFPAATETALNMAQALGTDTKEAAIQLGKALQDPVLGATALRRVGVNLGQSQMDLIKGFVNTGQSAKAQQVIMQELNTEFGNSARAYGQTLPGQLAILNNTFQKTKETMGGVIAAGIAPLVQAATTWVSKNQDLVVAAGLTAGAIVGITAAALGLSSVLALITIETLPFVALLGVLAALVGVTVFKGVQQLQGEMKKMGDTQKENTQVTALQIKQAAEMTDAQKKLQKQLADIGEQVKKENETFTENLAEMIKTHQDKVKTLKEQLDQENKDFTANEADKLRKFQQTIDAMNLSHDRFLDDNKTAVDRENADYAEATQKRLEDYTRKIELERQKGTEVSALKVQDLQKHLAEEQADAQVSHEQKIADLQLALSRENQDYSTHFSQTSAQYAEDTATAKSQHDAKVADTSTQLSTEVSLLDKHAADVDAVRSVVMRDEIDKLHKAHDEAIKGFADQAQQAKEQAGQTTQDLNDNYNRQISDAKNSGQQIGLGLAQGMGQAFFSLWDNFKKTLSDGWDALLDIFKHPFDSSYSISGLEKQASQFDKQTQDNIDWLNSHKAGARASGGPVSAGMLYQVNENGPEYFQPATDGFITPHGQGGGGSTTVIIQGDLHVDSEERMRQLMENISTMLGRQGRTASNGGI